MNRSPARPRIAAAVAPGRGPGHRPVRESPRGTADGRERAQRLGLESRAVPYRRAGSATAGLFACFRVAVSVYVPEPKIGARDRRAGPGAISGTNRLAGRYSRQRPASSSHLLIINLAVGPLRD